jgi:hypothetical protein
MLSIRTNAKPFRWVPLAFVAAAIGAPSAQAFFSADDLNRLTRNCLRDMQAVTGSAEPSILQPRAPDNGLDWGDTGIGIAIGVAGSLGLGAAALGASRRRDRLARA